MFRGISLFLAVLACSVCKEVQWVLHWGCHFHGNEFESFLFESADDFSDESSLDTIRLDHDE